MSKRRQQMYAFDHDLPEGKADDRNWVVYTRKKEGAPYRWAGYLDAVDEGLAMQYARDHYGLDEACAGILLHQHEALLDSEYGIDAIPGGNDTGTDGESWLVLTQRRRGMIHVSVGTVQATDAPTAIARARTAFTDGKITNVRVVRMADCIEACPDTLALWREHDMNYNADPVQHAHAVQKKKKTSDPKWSRP